MSALALALREAGIVPAEERLHALALQCLREHREPSGIYNESLYAATNFDRKRVEKSAMSAIKEFPRSWDSAKDAFYKAIRNDAALLWALFEPYRQVAVQKALTEAAAELREAERPQMVGAGQKICDGRDTSAPPNDIKPAMQAVAAVAQQSLLNTFRVNGKPIGDLTPREVNRWAASRERDARFVRLLTQNLPPDEPIRRFRSDTDAGELYERARQEVSDAE